MIKNESRMVATEEDSACRTVTEAPAKEESKRPRIYISGPMTSLPEEEVERIFRVGSIEVGMLGYEAVNPHMISGMPFEYEEYMQVDLAILNCCEGIYMLRGWEHSNGACREYMMALSKGMMIMYQEQEMNKDAE